MSRAGEKIAAGREMQMRIAEAESTLRLLAYQVGIKCKQCNVVIKDGEHIGGISFLAIDGVNFMASPYCVNCTERICHDL